MVREKKRLELFDRLRVGVRARTLHFPVTLGRMNLAHRLNAVGTFSKVTGTIVDILEGYALKDTHVNELQRKKDTRPGTGYRGKSRRLRVEGHPRDRVTREGHTRERVTEES